MVWNQELDENMDAIQDPVITVDMSTDAELGETIVREDAVIDNIRSAGAPAWFGPALDSAAVRSLEAKIDNMKLKGRNNEVMRLYPLKKRIAGNGFGLLDMLIGGSASSWSTICCGHGNSDPAFSSE
jgi:hypothetical protein